ncbi:hypothetical protein DENSPDRAFT_855377 [Dentipellis sp. KUC8613]|nr:hypothetical protein DENSPDRAFT_855377 [Dentipellis sp. KUC8613]
MYGVGWTSLADRQSDVSLPPYRLPLARRQSGVVEKHQRRYRTSTSAQQMNRRIREAIAVKPSARVEKSHQGRWAIQRGCTRSVNGGWTSLADRQSDVSLPPYRLPLARRQSGVVEKHQRRYRMSTSAQQMNRRIREAIAVKPSARVEKSHQGRWTIQRGCTCSVNGGWTSLADRQSDVPLPPYRLPLARRRSGVFEKHQRRYRTSTSAGKRDRSGSIQQAGRLPW